MLRLLLDHNLSPQIARQLQHRRPDCQVLSMREWHGGSFREASDEAILAAAYEERLTLVTYDVSSIVPLLKNWSESGRVHSGVILIDDRTILQKDIGGLVLALLRTYGEEAQLEWEDRVVYLRGR